MCSVPRDKGEPIGILCISSLKHFEPVEIVCDFEPALQNALQVRYPNVIVIGCLFHLIQALKRVMKRFAIPDVECIITIPRGVLDVLTVIALDQDELGTKWMKQEIRRRYDEPIARMNNPLERYNRGLNNRIPTHPLIATFGSANKTLLAEYVGRLGDIPRGRARCMPREGILLPVSVEISPGIEDNSDRYEST
ncbi:hypothetical protein PHMEG_00012177 [Phytophthora megakarya]|uniref:MULE transposase domain-containing protein n=1 Tax=Phytophthora megakarya TaxID=4795 RepID=A0A225W9T7_9STRA|nr:hypothetical protein PHMEG_00012177 [Phytophthora megakarya]